MKIMYPSLRINSLLSLSLALVFSQSSLISAPLAVQDSDIIGSSYNFNVQGGAGLQDRINEALVYDGTGSGGQPAAWIYRNEGNDVTYYYPTTGFSGQTEIITMGWDFSGSSYLVQSVNLKNYFTLFENNGITITLAYSTDNVNFTTYETISTASGVYPFVASSDQTVTLVQPASNFYVQISSYTADYPLGYNTQWARGTSADATVFGADFTVTPVPEPAAWHLMGVAALVAGVITLRRRQKTS